MVRYPAAETAAKHQKILDEASRLFRERGVSGVSVGDLMNAANLTHGSFYNHFESKQALVSECIDRVRRLAEEEIESNKPSEVGKRAFIFNYLSLTARDDPGHACLMSTLGVDVAREQNAKTAMTRYVQAFIGKLVVHFPWSRSKDARRNAIHMTASMVGALVLARAVDDEALSREILHTVITKLGSESKQKAE